MALVHRRRTQCFQLERIEALGAGLSTLLFTEEGAEHALRARWLPPADPARFLQLPWAHGSLEAEERSGILETGPLSSRVS